MLTTRHKLIVDFPGIPAGEIVARRTGEPDGARFGRVAGKA